MASTSNQEKGKIAANILECGAAVYNPDKLKDGKPLHEENFTDLIDGIGTLVLLPTLNTLVQPGRCQPWLRPHLTRALAHIPLRQQGVRHTIEFIFAVHPSTSIPSSEKTDTPDTRGANISLEALNAASKLLSTPPSDASPDAWFRGISPQLLALLDGEEGPELVKAAAYIIGYGILGKRATGAPGTPGWKSLVEPILGNIDPNISTFVKSESDNNSVIDFSTRNVLVTASDLAKALSRLSALVTSHPNPGLAKRLISHVFLPLWALYGSPSTALPEVPRNAEMLLKVFLQLANSENSLKILVQNFLSEGNEDVSHIRWEYTTSSDGALSIEKVSNNRPRELNLELIDRRVDHFIRLIERTKDLDGVDTLFLSMCRRWLQISDTNSAQILLTEQKDTEDYEMRIIEAKLLQAMMERIPTKLVENSTQLLQLVIEVIGNYLKANDQSSTETASIALSLVNFILTSTSFKVNDKNRQLVEQLEAKLKDVAGRKVTEVSTTADNLLMLLDFRSNEEADDELDKTPISDRYIEDQRTYKLALSYLTSTDSPPPVKVQGLDLICTLIKAGSPVVDIPAVLVLFGTTLQDDEDYVYLRSIECFVLLSIKHPQSVMADLTDRFVDANEDYQLDARLRIGEALLRVIEKSADSLHGELARKVGESLLGIAGRRGHRAKAEKEEAKRERLRARQQKQAEAAWGGRVPDLSELDGDDDAEEQFTERQLEDNAILRGIVEGWAGKRGSEDIRVRSSAVSILATTIESNAAGLGAAMVGSILDVCINILGIEREPTTAILRRSALMVLMSLLRAMDASKEEQVGKTRTRLSGSSRSSLQFTLAGADLENVLDILRYVAQTDSDGLVRQHANDVIEGFASYQENDLLRATAHAAQSGIRTELTELQGLQVQPLEEPGSRRPRIEEIE